MTTNRPKTGPSINIILEDETILAVEKPAGIASVPAKNGITNVAEQLAKTRPDLAKADPVDLGAVHRLDNGTSGILLFAKTKKAYLQLRDDFSSGRVTKKYTALVLGEAPHELTIDSPLIHDPKEPKKMKLAQKDDKKAQPAKSIVTRLKVFQGGKYSLVEVEIETGVRHQIRLHLASIGHPIAGDTLYQNARQRPRDTTKLKRQFLHATLLKFKHPASGKVVTLESPLPKELDKLISSL